MELKATYASRYPARFAVYNDGYVHYTNGKGDRSAPICDSATPQALAFDETGNDGHGLEVEFSRRVYNKPPVSVVIRKAELGRDPQQLRERLMNMGIYVSTNAYEFGLFLDMLNQMTADTATVTFSKQGWHNFTLPITDKEMRNTAPATREVYISPLGHLITDHTRWPRNPRDPKSRPIVDDAEWKVMSEDAREKATEKYHASPDAFDVTEPTPYIITRASFVKCALRDDRGVKDRNTGGTFRGWQEGVAAPIFSNHEALPHGMLGLAAGCAGTLLDFIGEDSCGLNFIGPSSTGKSTGQYVGASCWANPKPGCGILFSARNTDNQMEFLLARGRGASVHFDEAKTGQAAMIAALAFMLASGVGKGRLTKDLKQRDPTAFDGTFATLSSEFTIEALAAQAHITLPTGAAVRMPSVDTANLPPVSSAMVSAIKAATLAHYGHAGPRFAAWLAGCGPDAVRGAVDERLETLVRWWQGDGEKAVQPAQRRAWRVFALLWLTLDLMNEADILTAAHCSADGTSVEHKIMDAIEWGFWSFNGTGAAETLDTAEHATDALLAWLANNPGKVRMIGDGDRAAYDGVAAWHDGTTVFIPKASFAKLCGTSPKAVLDALKGRGLLQRRGDQQWTHEKLPGVSKQQHYRITLTIGVHNTVTDAARSTGTGAGLALLAAARAAGAGIPANQDSPAETGQLGMDETGTDPG